MAQANSLLLYRPSAGDRRRHLQFQMNAKLYQRITHCNYLLGAQAEQFRESSDRCMGA
jgi:hypothetical protein